MEMLVVLFTFKMKYLLLPIGVWLTYIFIFDKNKDELDNGEHLPKHDAKTETQGYVKLHRHIRNTYSDYDLEIKREPKEEGGGYTFIVEHWKRVWKIIFTLVPSDDEKPKT